MHHFPLFISLQVLTSSLLVYLASFVGSLMFLANIGSSLLSIALLLIYCSTLIIAQQLEYLNVHLQKHYA